VKSTICIIGCGNIGEALARGLSKKALAMSLCDSDKQKVSGLANDLGVRGSHVLAESLERATTVVLAVKPHIILDVAKQVNQHISKLEDKPLLVSLAAGVSYSELEAVFGDKVRLARVMPNLAMAFSEGASGVYSKSPIAAINANDLFSLVGKSVVVEKEDLLAAITGLSGSGPAFACAFMEGMVAAATELGLPLDISTQLAAQTVLGASQMVLEGQEAPESIMKRVTTPGGTTAKGLELFEKKEFRAIVGEAINAAYNRAKESMK